MSNSSSKSRAKSGATRRNNYAAAVIAAAEELASDKAQRKLNLAIICAHADVGTDAMYKDYHATTRSAVDAIINKWLVSHGRSRRRTSAESAPADEFSRLKDIIRERERQLNNTQHALNVLSQMLETALGEKATSGVYPIRPKR